MNRDRLNSGSSAERVALLAGWAGAAGLLSASSLSGAVVAVQTGGSVITVVRSNVLDVSAPWIGLEMDGNKSGGVYSVGGGADLAVKALGGGSFSVTQNGTGATSGAFLLALTQVGTQWVLANFSDTASIASHTHWASSLSYWLLVDSTWGSSGYLGFKINGSSEFGWVNISIDGTGAMTLSSWSPTQTPGTTDQSRYAATGTPEPAASGLGLLALGAAGVLRQRRRRKVAEEA